HHAVTRGNGRSNLPARSEDRCVPGRDLQHDANGFATGVIEMAAGDGNYFTMQLVSPAGVVLKHFRHTLNFAAAITYGFAAGEGFQPGERFGMVADPLPDGVHDAATLRVAQSPPGLLPLLGCGHRSLNGVGTHIRIAQGFLTIHSIAQNDLRPRPSL